MPLPFVPVHAKLTAFDENGIPVYFKTVDVMLSETHVSKVVVSRHPVGKGIPIADNVRPEPKTFECVAYFTDTPAAVDQIIEKTAKGLESVSETYDQLAEIMTKAWTFTVKTSFREYENMVLESMSVPRANDRANCIEASLKFVEFRKAQSVRVGIPAKKPAAKAAGKAAAKGAQTATTAAKETSKTVAKKALNFVTKLLK